MAKVKKKNGVPLSQNEKRKETSSLLPWVDDVLVKGWVSFVFLAVLFLFALLVRISFSRHFQFPLNGDSVIYAKIAWEIENGYGLHWWSVVWSPFYPFMIVLFSIFTGSLETATTMVSLVLGSLLVVPFFFLAKIMFNHRVAYLGSILVVFFPALVVISEVPLSEATYTFFLMITLLCGWLLFSRRSYFHALLFGIFSGICYLTRPEFLVAFVCLLLVFLIIELKARITTRQNTSVLLVISLLGFLILALPYVYFMHSQTGHWMLSGKMAHNILKEKAYASSANYPEQRQALAQMLDGLTPKGELKGKVLLGQESMFIFLKRPGFLGDYFRCIWLGLKQIDLFLAPFLMFSLFYIFSWKTEKRGSAPRQFLLFSFAPLLTMPVLFVVEGRLIEPYAPLIILMAVAGMLNLAKLAIRNRRHKSSEVANLFRYGTSLVVVAVLSVFSVAQAGRMAENYEKVFQATNWPAEYKKLGQWVDERLPQNASVMYLSPWDSLIFYCNRQAYPMPFAAWQEIVQFAKENHIKYLLISQGMKAYWRKDLAFLWKPFEDRLEAIQASNVKLIDLYRAPSGLKVVVYEFEF
jgi:4-amino-4-deoxy-L-arabinose transferase-like glycosyltransferase